MDKKNYCTKPDNQEAKLITNRIAEMSAEMSLETIAEYLVQPYGRTFAPAVFHDNKRSNSTWGSQQLFGLDFDEGITMDEVLERCSKYGIHPCFIYSTFSSTNNNKFRVFFCNETEVTDYRIRTVIQSSLMRMFKESDKSCKDGSRIFYGGKELLYKDYDKRINPVDLLRELCRYIQDSDSVNASREIKHFCQLTGLDMLNGMPKVLPQVDDSSTIDGGEKNGDFLEYSEVKVEEITSTPINNIYIGHAAKSSKMTFLFYFNYQNSKTIGSNKPQSKFTVVNERIEREYVRDFSFDQLEGACRLYQKFITGEYWAYHKELIGIATNLLIIKGGRDKFIKALNENNYDINKWEYYCNYFIKMDYAPMQCDNFCPFAESCEHTRNMIEQVKLPIGQVRTLYTPDIKTLEQAEKELMEHMKKILDSNDNKIYVIKAPTGIGKTELYLELNNVTIALPTHKLKDEVSERMKVKHRTTPKIPEDDRLKYLYSVGSYMMANQYIQKMAKEGNLPYQAYLNDRKLVANHTGTLLTTHDKLLSLKSTNNTIIIDEDIISTLLPVNTTTLADLETMVEECYYFDTMHTLMSIKDFAKVAGDGLVYEMPSYGGIKTSRLEELVIHNKINTNILGFLNCSHFVKYTFDDKVVFYFINKRELPEKKKIIMLSATANETICKQMFGDRLEFIDIGQVETRGEIHQYPQKSFSRYQMNEKKNLKILAQALAKGKAVISYKDENFENTIAHFGGTAGLDGFKGQDIAVIGTPHVNPTVYLLYANAMGKKPRLNDCRTSMQYTKIRRNGFEFYFNTFSNNEILQEIQLYLIESELLQAIGRARILRYDCTVTVLSNLPIQGAEFKYLTKKEVAELLGGDKLVSSAI